MKVEQEKRSLVNIMEDLSMNDAVVERKTFKADSPSNKTEKHTGTNV